MRDKQMQIIGYWAKAQLHYRQPEGDKACEELRKIIDADTTNAIFAITGLVSAGILRGKRRNIEKLKELASYIERNEKQ